MYRDYVMSMHASGGSHTHLLSQSLAQAEEAEEARLLAMIGEQDRAVNEKRRARREKEEARK